MHGGAQREPDPRAARWSHVAWSPRFGVHEHVRNHATAGLFVDIHAGIDASAPKSRAHDEQKP